MKRLTFLIWILACIPLGVRAGSADIIGGSGFVLHLVPWGHGVTLSALRQADLSQVDVFVLGSPDPNDVLFQQSGIIDPLTLEPEQDGYLVLRPRNLPIPPNTVVTLSCNETPVQERTWGSVKKRFSGP